MRVLIVENEKPASDKLCRLLQKMEGEITVLAVLESVEDVINWWQSNTKPDLVFMDIQLDDGLCFEIFDTIKMDTPVVFTTAYEQYAIKAFEVNSVDYLLKPIEESALARALEKFKSYHNPKVDYSEIQKGYDVGYKSRFLVKVGIKYKSVRVEDISFFYISERCTFVKTIEGHAYALDYSLDKLQQFLCPDDFFRINRNCIINITAIDEMIKYSSSRLMVKPVNEQTSELFVVSRDKVAKFREWMDR